MQERVGEHLNRALHELFARDERMYLLGEDILDPYGGAFRVTRGLSTDYPDRVVTTPLSENGILGVAGGLALAGNRVFAEVMFGDFVGLAFDQILNFATKSAAMYGRRVPMSLVVRCPSGGNRGYGPTHSQSPQKHFIGIPHLSLRELSPFHDAAAVLRAAFATAEPCLFVEDKVLYTRRMFGDGVVDDRYRYEQLAGPGDWVRVYAEDSRDTARVALIAAGGMVHRALDSVKTLSERDGIEVELLVPSQLYPLALEPVLPFVAAAGRACVVEESTAGGTWGAEVAAGLHTALWDDLVAPVLQLSSRDSVIPAAPHLERTVILQHDTITAAVADLARRAAARHSAVAATAAAAPALAQVAAPVPAAEPVAGRPIVIPTLNTNDTSCVLVEWLVADGSVVAPGAVVAMVETSKATNDIEAEGGGVLRQVRKEGDDCEFGETIGYLDGPDGGGAAPRETAPAPAVETPQPAAAQDRVQAAVAAAVTRSHRTIPAAFGAARATVDSAIAFLERLSDDDGADIDLPALVVRAVAALQADYPTLYGTVDDDGVPREATSTGVAVTMDAGAGLFLPVVTDAATRGLPDIADDLVEFRLLAVEGKFPDSHLQGAAISVSLNLVDGVTLVQPLIMPPQVAMVSVSGIEPQLRRDAGGEIVEIRTVTLGLSYDHRAVNGRTAALYLTALKALIEKPEQLA